jgi:MFS family permease
VPILSDVAATPLGPTFRKLYTASALSNLADGVFQVALPLLALRLTRSPAAVAGVALAGRLPWLLFALQAGALADRLDRLRTMVRVDAARVVVIGGLATIVALGHEHLVVLYVVAFALGIGETLFDTAAQSIMPMVVHRDELARANSKLYAAEMIANQFVGPPLGGILAGVAIALAFSGSAACYLVAFLALLLIRGSFKPAREGEAPTRIRTDIVEGLRYLYNHRLLRTLALMVGVMNLCNTAVWSVLPVYAVKPGPMGLTDSGFGVFLTTLAAGSLVGSWITPWMERTLGRSKLLGVSVVASGLMLLAPLLRVPWVVGVALFVTGIPFMAWNIVTVSLRQRIVPDRLLGRVNSGYRLLAWGTMPIGAGLGGLLAELFGVRLVFVAGGVASLALLALMPIVSDKAIDAAEAEAEPYAASPDAADPADEAPVGTP